MKKILIYGSISVDRLVRAEYFHDKTAEIFGIYIVSLSIAKKILSKRIKLLTNRIDNELGEDWRNKLIAGVRDQ